MTAGMPLDLTAGGLGNRARLEQHDVIDLNIVLFRDSASNGLRDEIAIGLRKDS